MHDYSTWGLRDLYKRIRELDHASEEIRIEKVAVVRAIEARRAESGSKPDRFGHNLSSEAGIAPREARQISGLALGLEHLPEVAKGVESGEIKVDVATELLKFATPEEDRKIADQAKSWSVPQAEEAARRRRAIAEKEARKLHETRSFRWFYDADRRHVNFKGLFPAAEGELLISVIETEVKRADAKRAGGDENCCADSGTHTDPGRHIDSGTHVHGFASAANSGPRGDTEQGIHEKSREEYSRRCADALISTLSSGSVSEVFAGSRAQVTVVATAQEMSSNEAAVRVGSGFVSAEVARRLMCDSDIEVVLVDQQNRPIGLGANTRSVPKRLSRLIRARDKTCVFPNCNEDRHIQIHHVVHAAKGGRTIEENLAALCFFHHHLVHEGGWLMMGTASSGLVIKSPYGQVYETGPLVMELAQVG
ncbi:MAG: hypothetical protein DCC49_04465 [Acidobacteria bacterium]|nr:MAG: hypothetical protein DCC49_04465 [Acidobacteriota bacterium]